MIGDNTGQQPGSEALNNVGQMVDEVTFQHPDYIYHLPTWQMVSDVVAGQREIQQATTTYLPMPNPIDRSDENIQRYAQYVKRAVFYGMTGRTLQSLIGAAFRKPPVVVADGAISYVVDNIDGAGISITQQSQMALSYVLQHGRAGLLVDFPAVDRALSVADDQSGRYAAKTILYPATSVINWRTTQIGARILLSLVVLRESCETMAGNFASKMENQYRVLRLTVDGCTQEVFRKVENTWVSIGAPVIIRNSAGAPWREIPFAFIGAINNDPNPDRSPLADIASLNIAHYHNSADYEESVFVVGQAQPWLSGLTIEWRDHLEQQRNLYFGSRSPILLPENGAYGLAQAAANSMAYEAMVHKEELMKAMGARLLTPGGAVKTATEAQSENEAEHSVLSLAAANVSEAYEKALGWMAQFNGAGNGEFEINQEFTRPVLDPQMLAQLLAAVNSEKLPNSDLWRALRNSGQIDENKTDEMIKEELASQSPNLDMGMYSPSSNSGSFPMSHEAGDGAEISGAQSQSSAGFAGKTV